MKTAIALSLVLLAGCTTSLGFKRDQLICLGVCWEAETEADKTTGTTIESKGKHNHD
jgi:hypothetical protein